MELQNNRHHGISSPEQQIAFAIEAANIGYWNYDPQTQQLSSNNKTKTLFGFPADKEMHLSQALDHIHADDRPLVIKAIEDALNFVNDGHYEIEYRVVLPPNNTIIHVRALGQAFRSQDGKPWRFSGTVQDVTASKKAQQDLVFRKALLEAQNNAIPDAMLIVDAEGKILSYNHRFAELWQMPQEIIERGDDEAALAHAMTLLEDPEAFIERVHYLYQHPSETSDEEIRLKDGRILQRFGQSVIGEDGTYFGWSWYFRDVTEQKRWEEKLRQSKDRFQGAVQAVQGVLWTNNAKGEMEGEQPGWEALTGQSFAEYQGYGWSAAIHPDDVQATIEGWQKALAEKQLFVCEHRVKLKDGSYGIFAVRAVPVLNDDGSIREWVGVHTNITKEREAQQALVESEDLFRTFSNNISNLAWIADGDGWIKWYNQRWYDYTGTTFDEMQGWGWEKVHHPDHRQRVVDLVKEIWKKPEPFELVFPLRAANRTYRWFLTRGEPIVDVNGKIIRWIGTNTDINEQIETAEALKRSELSVKMLMEKKDEFMSIASHELKTPMTSLRAAIQLIHRITETNSDQQKLHSLAEKANTQVQKLVTLIEDLLDVTKINAGKLVLNPVEFNISQLLQDCIEHAKLAGATQTIELSGDEDVHVFADRNRIEQVLNNLINNAVKYSPDTDHIGICISASKGQLKITVTDHGIGIPEEKLHFVFDRFFRLHDRSQRFAGIGLGLYISAEIVRRHGGQIGASSKEGQGSTFWFTIPLDQKNIQIS